MDFEIIWFFGNLKMSVGTKDIEVCDRFTGGRVSHAWPLAGWSRCHHMSNLGGEITISNQAAVWTIRASHSFNLGGKIHRPRGKETLSK